MTKMNRIFIKIHFRAFMFATEYLIFLLILSLFPAPVNAKGKHVNMDNTKTSGVVVIGDSRICNLAKRVRSYGESREKYSFNLKKNLWKVY